jgi:hypothetical protein
MTDTTTATTTATKGVTRVCKDCGRIGSRGFTPNGSEHQCTRRLRCRWRREARAIDQGWR